MPRSKKDGLYFKDFEKLVFGDEEGLQATMYHDGAGVVFENITISGAQGPAGPPGAGIPGGIITNESGYTGMEASSNETMDFWQNNNSLMNLNNNTVVIGQNQDLNNNWGSLMIKSKGVTYDEDAGGLKLAYFGDNGYQQISFLRSTSVDTAAPVASAAGYNIGGINWGTWVNNGNSLGYSAKMVGKESYTSGDIHNIDIKFQTKNTEGDWLDNLTICSDNNGRIKLSKGQAINGIALDFNQLDTTYSGLSPTDFGMTAYGIQRAITSVLTAVDQKFTSISGAQSWEVFDPTYTAARIETLNEDNGLNPHIDFSINGNVLGQFTNNNGFILGRQGVGLPLAEVVACISDESMDDTYILGDTISTTAATKAYIDLVARTGAGSNYLRNTYDNMFTIGQNEISTVFDDNTINLEMKYTTDVINLIYPANYIWQKTIGARDGTSRSGPRMVVGSKKFSELEFFNSHDIGHSGPMFGFRIFDIIDYYSYNWIDDSSNKNYDYDETVYTVDGEDPTMQIHSVAPRSDWVNSSWVIYDKWNNKQWTQRIKVEQKHNFIVTGDGGASAAIVGWNEGNYSLDKGYSYMRGPQLAFIKSEDDFSHPTHCGKNDLIGRIAFDYKATDGGTDLDRGGWIECRTGYHHALNYGIDGKPLGDVAGLPIERDEWHFIENEIYIGASPYIHCGRIRLRSKLFFDDGSENFVSGIIQSENSDVQKLDFVYRPSGITNLDNPWGNSTPERFPYGLDHVIPTAKWVQDQIVNVKQSIESPIVDRISNFTSPNSWTGDTVAQASSEGFIVRTGYNGSKGLVFGISGAADDNYGTYPARATWGMRYAAKVDSTKFFMENYEDTSEYTNYITFFRARGGHGMFDEKTAGSSSQMILSGKDNGQIQRGYAMGVIQAYGQALGNGIDNDPCAHWVRYKPAGQITFRADRVTNSRVWGRLEFDTGYSSRSKSGILDSYGSWHFGSVDGSVTGSNPGSVNYSLFSPIINKYRGVVNICGGFGPASLPYSYSTDKATLNLVSYSPSLSFSTETIQFKASEPNASEIHCQSRIMYYGGESDYGKGLSFWMWDGIEKRERQAMLITTDRNIIIGRDFDNDDSGIVNINCTSTGENSGLSIRSYSNQSSKIKLYYNASGLATINAGANGDEALRINANEGTIYLGDKNLDLPENGNKLIVTGNIVPSTDNTWDLGTSILRWDDMWATNGTIQVSDARDKEEIKSETLGTSFINKLRPVSFKRTDGTRIHHGLIAQEVEETVKGLGKSTEYFAGLIHDEESDKYGLRYEEFIGPMIKAIQELTKEVANLKAQLEG